jgi:hypothetical protein
MKRIFKAATAAALALVPLAAGAISLLPPCTKLGNCGISDMLAVFINLAEYLLGIVGAVALGYFVYGGFLFILSRGNKGEVDKAMGVLRAATIGIFIIFLSGVLVRFTTQALTGGNSAIPTIGETCNPDTKTSVLEGNGLWISIPSGLGDNGKPIPESLECVKKEVGLTPGAECGNLNAALTSHGRTEKYTCMKIGEASNCVRGLCNLGSDYACCLK